MPSPAPNPSPRANGTPGTLSNHFIASSLVLFDSRISGAGDRPDHAGSFLLEAFQLAARDRVRGEAHEVPLRLERAEGSGCHFADATVSKIVSTYDSEFELVTRYL